MQEEKKKYRRLKLPNMGIVIKVFKHYEMIKKAVMEYRNDNNMVGSGQFVNSKTSFSSPTERKAIYELSEIRSVTCEDGFICKRPERWLEVINKTLNYCKKEDKIIKRIVELWIDGHSIIKICLTLNVSRTRCYEILNQVQCYALSLAIQKGLTKIEGD